MWKCRVLTVSALLMILMVTGYPFLVKAVKGAISKAKDWILSAPAPEIHATDFVDATAMQMPHGLSPGSERNPPKEEIRAKYEVKLKE